MAKRRHNWRCWTYLDTRSGRHSDPYTVLVLEPLDPQKTSPTYDDIFMFLDEMLKVERCNDISLKRMPQLPTKINRIKNILTNYEGDLIEQT